MLKKILKKNVKNSIETISIPNHLSNIILDNKGDGSMVNRNDEMINIKAEIYKNNTSSTTQIGIEDLLYGVQSKLLGNQQFMQYIVDEVSKRVLAELITKYEFEPTDKYLQVVDSRKKYINQLDAYLEEREEINQQVNNDLQRFLQDTTMALSKALDSFGLSVQNKIKEAETQHGIAAIRESIMQEKIDSSDKNSK